MFVRAKRRGSHTYLMIVESFREEGKVKQRTICNLGRLDKLYKSNKLDGLIKSAERFSDHCAVLSTHDQGKSITTKKSRIGPSLIFERLWHTVGIDGVIKEMLADRKFEFSVERAIFLTVLHRLFSPGSDRAAEKWKKRYIIDGADKIELHHLYRAMAWLGEALPLGDGMTTLAPRCIKDLIEEQLFLRHRDLFSSFDLVFFDTTSIYFEGEGGETLGNEGYSRDHRSDLKQMVVGIVLDNEGRPVCSELWPGNTADVKALVPVVERLKKKFAIHNICIVADRGMISKDTMKEIEALEWKYILGVRMRRCNEVKKDVLSRGGRYREVFGKSETSKNPSPLKVKEVWLNDRRYIVCLNEDQALKDRYDREAILESLRDALKHGDKTLIGNKGFRRFVQATGERFVINMDKVQEEERYDGKWVLTTNTSLSTHDAALKYKQLWMVEDIFRSMKSLMRTRPIYHKRDETIRGHVFCSFVALVLRKELQDRLDEKGWKCEWADIISDLDDLLEMEIKVNGKSYVIRSETNGTTGKVAQACGVALPPTLRQL